MSSTYWTVPASEKGRLSTNYVFVGDRRSPIDPGAASVFLQRPSFPYGGAGLVSTARDYDRFLHMLANGGMLDGKRVMKAETVALAMSNLMPAGVSFTRNDASTGGAMSARMGFGAGGSVYLEDMPGGASKSAAAAAPMPTAVLVVIRNIVLKTPLPRALQRRFRRCESAWR